MSQICFGSSPLRIKNITPPSCAISQNPSRVFAGLKWDQKKSGNGNWENRGEGEINSTPQGSRSFRPYPQGGGGGSSGQPARTRVVALREPGCPAELPCCHDVRLEGRARAQCRPFRITGMIDNRYYRKHDTRAASGSECTGSGACRCSMVSGLGVLRCSRIVCVLVLQIGAFVCARYEESRGERLPPSPHSTPSHSIEVF